MQCTRAENSPLPDDRPSGWDSLATSEQLDQLHRLARQRKWWLAFLAVGWLHLLAFLICNYLSVSEKYHSAPGYLAVWISELLCMALIVRLCAGPRCNRAALSPMARFVVRVWVAYFVLAFNLGTMNKLRGNEMFELLPAMASLASFAFLVMTFAVNRWFFGAVLVMFAAGLLMSAYLLYAYLVFAWAWWIVLNGIGICLMSRRVSSLAAREPTSLDGSPVRSDESCKSARS
jgi:hypothetical protein